MCGIVALYNKKCEGDLDLLSKMTSSLRHRGPDYQESFYRKNVGLGHCRLKIIDLSDSANQPIGNEDSTIWLVYNGEIYNFKKIRNVLIKLGYKFKSRTDSEVVLHAYEEWGFNCLMRFNGIFAFALWDTNEDILWLVRDPFGVKPLYFYNNDSVFVAASEIRTLFIHPEVSVQPDFRDLLSCLNVLWVPTPKTGFHNIYKLEPAHYLIVSREGIKKRRYHRFKVNDKYADLSSGELSEALWTDFNEAVSRQLVSDVDVGVYLSGGIDSASIAVAASQQTSKTLKSFSMAFKSDEKYNEAPIARKIAEKLNLEHYEITFPENPVPLFQKFVTHMGEPNGIYSGMCLFHLAEQASKHVSVVLTGDGGD